MPFFFHRVFSYRPAKPRNPLAKLLLGLVGLVLLGALLVFGLVAGLGMLLFAGIRRALNAQAASATARRAQADVIEGEFRVVNDVRERISAPRA
ncbi:hypothetical protein [Arenimonas composti]|uniref:Uncharacterized protein n=1 Tax=Arenimonas composti TR7-09 = DSM 18010 TaxID=1121013 RepID=A0A091BC52_9GAMM|nr:hypothetical protein [Arenimonas composti]KFN49331.1 hypothetical protein P873_11200 [Arenimonas composti TR7-09 = DSM 18010]